MLQTSAPDGGWGWAVVAASFAAHVIADGCGFSFGVLFGELLEVFGESKATTAWVGSLFVSVPAICGPIASAVTNSYGCRATTMVGGLIAAFGCFAAAFANSIGELCFSFGIVSGFGLSMVFVPAVVVVAFYFEKKRAFATGIAVAGSGIGTFIFAPLTEFLIERYHWRGAFMITSGIMLNTVLCGAIFRPLNSESANMNRSKRRRSHGHRPQETKKPAEEAGKIQRDSGDDAKIVVELESDGKPHRTCSSSSSTSSSYAQRMKHRIQENLSNLRLFRISETSNASLSGDSDACRSVGSDDDSSSDSSSSSSSEDTVERLCKSEPNLFIDRSRACKKTSPTVRNPEAERKRRKSSSCHRRHHRRLDPTSRQFQQQTNVADRFIVARLARSTACIGGDATPRDDPNHFRPQRCRSMVPIDSIPTSHEVLHRESSRAWPATVLLHHGDHRYQHLIDSVQNSRDDSSSTPEAIVALLHSEKELPGSHRRLPSDSPAGDNTGVKRFLQRPSCHFIDCNCPECSAWRHLVGSQEKVASQNHEPKPKAAQPSHSLLPLITNNNNNSSSNINNINNSANSGNNFTAPMYLNNRSASDHGENMRSFNSLAKGGSSATGSGSDKFFFISGRQDMVYRGSLLRTGFFVSHGRSASCPEVCITPSKRYRHAREEKSNFLTSILCCCCEDYFDSDDVCCLENSSGHVCAKKCQPRQHAMARNFGLGKLIKSTVARFGRMVDLSVFRSPVFAFFNLHTVFLYLSYDIPYIYGPVRATEFEISDSHASLLVAIIGIFSMIGQVAMGYLGDLPCIDVTSFYNSMTAIAGCMVLLIPSVTTFLPMSAIYAGYGFFISANFALTTVILVELLGMNRLTNAFGIVSLAQGVANLVGPPFAGWLSDQTMSYNLAFYGSGAIILISGLMLFFTPCLAKCDKYGGKSFVGNLNEPQDVVVKSQREINATGTSSSKNFAINFDDLCDDELVLRIESSDGSSAETSRTRKSSGARNHKVKEKLKSTLGCRSTGEGGDKVDRRKTNETKTPDIVITEVSSSPEECHDLNVPEVNFDQFEGTA